MHYSYPLVDYILLASYIIFGFNSQINHSYLTQLEMKLLESIMKEHNITTKIAL